MAGRRRAHERKRHRTEGVRRYALKRHSRVRARQRHGLDLGPIRERKIVDAIRGGQARFCWKTSNRVSVFDVELEGNVLRVAFDRKRGCLVTVLPRKAG